MCKWVQSASGLRRRKGTLKNRADRARSETPSQKGGHYETCSNRQKNFEAEKDHAKKIEAGLAESTVGRQKHSSFPLPKATKSTLHVGQKVAGHRNDSCDGLLFPPEHA